MYLTHARFSLGWYRERYAIDGLTQIDGLIFAALALLMVALLLFHISRRLAARPTLVLMVAAALIWVLLCQMICGALAGWALLQTPVSPVLGLMIVVVNMRIESTSTGAREKPTQVQ